MPHIESIESRTLFAANVHVPDALIQLAEASANPTVQATLNLVKADLTALNEARGGADARAELRQIVDTGLAQLATARDAVRAAREAGDPATRDAALATLKATRQELKTTLTNARANLRNASIENREALRTATTSLRQHLKQLRQDIRTAIANPTAPPSPTGGQSGIIGGTLPNAAPGPVHSVPSGTPTPSSPTNGSSGLIISNSGYIGSSGSTLTLMGNNTYTGGSWPTLTIGLPVSDTITSSGSADLADRLNPPSN